MNTIKCSNCGKVNKLKLEAGSLSNRVTLRCGDCKHPLLSIDVENKSVDWSAYWKRALTIFKS